MVETMRKERKLDTMITSRGSKLSSAIKQYQEEEDEEDEKDNKAKLELSKHNKQKIEQQQQAYREMIRKNALRRRNTMDSSDKSSPLGYSDL